MRACVTLVADEPVVLVNAVRVMACAISPAWLGRLATWRVSQLRPSKPHHRV